MTHHNFTVEIFNADGELVSTRTTLTYEDACCFIRQAMSLDENKRYVIKNTITVTIVDYTKGQ